jgi:uncharacterized protein with PQ loop repeat
MKFHFIDFMTGLAIVSSALIYLQVYKVYERQSHDDISFIVTLFQVFNSILWSYYGFILKSMPLMVSGSLAAIGFSVLLFLKLTITSKNHGWKYI